MRRERKLSGWDRFLLSVAPRFGMERIKARSVAQTFARHYEAAQSGRRTSAWKRNGADANQSNRQGLQILREHARDLIRNNGWAENGLRVICRNTVGWGIQAKALAPGGDGPATHAQALWKTWSESKTCDVDGRFNFAGLQKLVIRSMVTSGEVLVRRRMVSASEGLAIPMKIQVLESDYLDHLREGPAVDGFGVPNGNVTIQGIEFDAMGNRIAYWLFEHHPGSMRIAASMVSKRVSADQVLHIYRLDRPGQVRGITWLASSIVKLKDSDDYEDASLMSAKVAACFSAFVQDPQGEPTPVGGPDEENDDADAGITETLEPGMISHLPPGKTITFASPPVHNDAGATKAYLRRIASSMGVPCEELTGDYSEVNFSSARMSRIAHRANVNDWRWDIMIPLFCDPVFAWAMQAALLAGELDVAPTAQWTAPPLPMIEPDKEGLALTRLVRAGAMTHDEMIREQGDDPDTHWEQYSKGLERIRKLGITLDSDAGMTTQQGLAQVSTPEEPGAEGIKALPAGGKAKPGKPAADDSTDAELDS